MKKLLTAVVAALLVASAGPAWASNFTEAISTDWHNTANWTAGVPNGGGGGAIINVGTTADVTRNTTFNGDFLIDHDATVNIKNGATLTQTGGTQWWSQTSDTWALNITEGARLVNVDGDAIFGAGPNAIATITLNNGTWDHFNQIMSGSTNNRWYINMSNGSVINANNFYLRNENASNSAVLKGSGQISCWSSFRNNGRVEASGGVLEFVRLPLLRDDQGFGILMNDGNRAGWYASNQGTLRLPTLFVGAGTNWGEEITDATLDIVNSLQISNVNVWGGMVDIDLVASDLGSVQPGLVNPIGIWVVRPADGLTTADLQFRYDENAAAALSDVKLFYNDTVGGGWVDITNTDSGTIITSLGGQALAGQFAVAEDAVPGGVPGGVIPEPAGLGLIGIALLGLRKKRC